MSSNTEAWVLPDNSWEPDDYNLFHFFDRSGPQNATRLYMLVLYGLARSNGWTRIVELGAFQGNTTALLAHAVTKNGGGVVHTFERDSWRAAALRDRFQTNPAVVVHECLSQTAAPLPTSPHAIFVDGDHTYEGCLGDLVRWGPQLAHGGYLILHDAADPAVRRAFDDARSLLSNPPSLYFPGDHGLLIAQRLR